MTIRISAFIRDHVVKSATKGRFAMRQLEVDKLEDVYKKLLDEQRTLAYEAAFSKKDRELMASLPKGWLPERGSCQVMVEEEGVRHLQFADQQRVPFSGDSENYGSASRVVGIITRDCKYLKKEAEQKAAFDEYSTASRQLREERHALEREVEAVVSSVTTVKRLIEIWPEVAEHLPEVVSDPLTTVPAVMIADLNAKLGLTPKPRSEAGPQTEIKE